MKTEKEIWVDCVFYPEKYSVSNLGKFKNKITNKILKGGITLSGYRSYRIQNYGRGKWKSILLHRIVFFSFNPDADRKNDIHHLDGNRLNNRLNNLDLLSRSDHAKIAFPKNIGKYTNKANNFGKKSPAFKSRIAAFDKNNRLNYIFEGSREIQSSIFNRGNVYSIINATGNRKFDNGHYFIRIDDNVDLEIGKIYDTSKI